MNIDKSRNETDTGTEGKICIPSFETERKSGAFNRQIWSFVALVSVITVGGILPVLFVLVKDGILGWTGSFIGGHLPFFILVPAAAALLLAIPGRGWINSLLYSYRIEPGRIVRGRIREAEYLNGMEILMDQALSAGGLGSLLHRGEAGAYLQIRGIRKNLKRARANMAPGFAEKYFDTEAYEKTVYENPRLAEEKKYTLVYRCGDGKRLEIPKIYEGMCEVSGEEKPSFPSRIMKRSLVVFLLALIPYGIDLANTGSHQDAYQETMEKSYGGIEEELQGFGWVPDGNTGTFCREAGEGKESCLRYTIDHEGNVKNVDIQIYYGKDDVNIGEELDYILGTLDDGFEKEELQAFIQAVVENVEGGSSYGKLVSQNGRYQLVIGRSEGYVDVHNYQSL